jgi:hypothetical protein
MGKGETEVVESVSESPTARHDVWRQLVTCTLMMAKKACSSPDIDHASQQSRNAKVGANCRGHRRA